MGWGQSRRDKGHSEIGEGDTAKEAHGVIAGYLYCTFFCRGGIKEEEGNERKKASRKKYKRDGKEDNSYIYICMEETRTGRVSRKE